MKIQIRHGVFETNSSSTHSLTMCTKDQFEKWKQGELVYKGHFGYNGELVTLEQKQSIIESKKCYGEDDFKTYKDFEDFWDLETFSQEFTTPSGETIIAFGAFGYEG